MRTWRSWSSTIQSGLTLYVEAVTQARSLALLTSKCLGERAKGSRSFVREMAPPIQPLIEGLNPDQRREVFDEAIAKLAVYDDGERVTMPIQVVVASAHR